MLLFGRGKGELGQELGHKLDERHFMGQEKKNLVRTYRSVESVKVGRCQVVEAVDNLVAEEIVRLVEQHTK